MGIWSFAEIVAGFLVLCLPAMPKLFIDLPWVHKFLSIFKTKRGPSSGKPSRAFASPRATFKCPKRPDVDASLFTDSNTSDVVPLTNLIVTSEFTLQIERVVPEDREQQERRIRAMVCPLSQTAEKH
jgi:hypothetical protein